MFIKEFFQSDKIPAVIKWAVTIIVTGFIAQFGKRLADFLIKKIRGRKSHKSPEDRLPIGNGKKPPTPFLEKDDTIIEATLEMERIRKMDKKALKTQAKQEKKFKKSQTKKLKKEANQRDEFYPK